MMMSPRTFTYNHRHARSPTLETEKPLVQDLSSSRKTSLKSIDLSTVSALFRKESASHHAAAKPASNLKTTVSPTSHSTTVTPEHDPSSMTHSTGATEPQVISRASSPDHRPATPTTPVQIPRKTNRPVNQSQRRPAYHGTKSRREMRSPESLSPSMAALLAMTDIPKQRRQSRGGRRISKGGPDANELPSSASENDMAWMSHRWPMDMLLSPPLDATDDDASISESIVGSILSTRTTSVDSFLSLGDSYSTDLLTSLETSSSSQRRRNSSMRKSSLEPIRSPSDAIEDHPLAGENDPAQQLQGPQSVAADSETALTQRMQVLQPFKPLKAVFKSNLTASLRALRSAAKSFSSFNFPMLPADDFLARSMLTIDPNVPYTDERRPPLTEELPSAELRRYLNPAPNSQLGSGSGSGPADTPQRFSASIQMQTYKIRRSQSAPPRASSAVTPSQPAQPVTNGSSTSPHSAALPPGMRQREMRENSDFIRVAVMEMAMRKRGKLDGQQPGRARWALPPRKTSTRPYIVGSDGTPERWVPLDC